MRRFAKQIAGLVLTAALASGLTARADEKVERPGIGPAYDRVGQVAVMHQGRVKPLDTVAREEVKQVYGRETIALRDPKEEVAKILDPEKAGRVAGVGAGEPPVSGKTGTRHGGHGGAGSTGSGDLLLLYAGTGA